MRRLLIVSLLCASALAMRGDASGQKKQAPCRANPPIERNWELVGRDYMYFGYTLCPPDVANDSRPLVTVWFTLRGDGISVVKWRKDRHGADQVSLSRGDKRAYIIFHDLDAIPVGLLKAESRGGIPAETAKQPFLAEGKTLIPAENLPPEAAQRIKKAFEYADALIQKGESEVSLLHESNKMVALADLLNRPFKPE